MCDRKTSVTDPTADFILSDLLTATEDLIDFAINLFDTIRLQTHFNDRNRRIGLSTQLQDLQESQKAHFGFVDIPIKLCTVSTTLKYDFKLYLDRIFQACKRTKSNLLLLRASRNRPIPATLLLNASTSVRVEQLEKKVQLLTRLVKENGGDFQTKKKKKKTKLDENPNESSIKKPTLNLMSKEDLNDYVEIALSFRTIISKYREFIEHVRNGTKSTNQASIANSLVLIPIAGNAINELNNILNRLTRIAFTIEAEANYLRQPPKMSISNENKKDKTLITSTERIEPIKSKLSQNETTIKQNNNNNNIRNQSAVISPTSSTISSFKLTPNMITNIFEDFFYEYERFRF